MAETLAGTLAEAIRAVAEAAVIRDGVAEVVEAVAAAAGPAAVQEPAVVNTNSAINIFTTWPA